MMQVIPFSVVEIPDRSPDRLLSQTTHSSLDPENALTSSFMMPETNEMRCGTSKIISFAVPLCLTDPLIVKCRPTLAISEILDLGMKGLVMSV